MWVDAETHSQTLSRHPGTQQKKGENKENDCSSKDTISIQSPESVNRVSLAITETKATVLEPYGSRSSEYMSWMFNFVFLWDTYQWMWGLIWLFLPIPGTLFFILDCLVQSCYEGLCFYCNFLYHVHWCPWEACFSEENAGDVYLGGRWDTEESREVKLLLGCNIWEKNF